MVQELVPQKSLRSKSGELITFETAISAKKISQSTDEEIKQSLRYAMLLVGIRVNTINQMEDEEKDLIVSFVRQKYPMHTPEEIKIAFTKAAAYELDVDPSIMKTLLVSTLAGFFLLTENGHLP